ncbi:MAG: N-acetyltransferase, partial [Methylovirgula sp.]
MFPDLTRDDVFRLETTRLWLRWPRASDAAAVAAFAALPQVAQMTGNIPHPYP